MTQHVVFCEQNYCHFIAVCCLKCQVNMLHMAGDLMLVSDSLPRHWAREWMFYGPSYNILVLLHLRAIHLVYTHRGVDRRVKYFAYANVIILCSELTSQFSCTRLFGLKCQNLCACTKWMTTLPVASAQQNNYALYSTLELCNILCKVVLLELWS